MQFGEQWEKRETMAAEATKYHDRVDIFRRTFCTTFIYYYKSMVDQWRWKKKKKTFPHAHTFYDVFVFYFYAVFFLIADAFSPFREREMRNEKNHISLLLFGPHTFTHTHTHTPTHTMEKNFFLWNYYYYPLVSLSLSFTRRRFFFLAKTHKFISSKSDEDDVVLFVVALYVRVRERGEFFCFFNFSNWKLIFLKHFSLLHCIKTHK